MFRLTNPLPEVLLDPKGLTNFYQEWNLLPYAGHSTYTGHSFLRLLNDLYDLSPSKGTVVEDLKNWAFDGEIEVVRQSIQGLKVDEDANVSDAEALAFAEYLESIGITLPMIIEITQELEVSMAKNGNAWLHYVEVELNGVWYVDVKPIDALQIMYLNTDPGEPRVAIHSKDFFNVRGFQEEPQVLRVYPYFNEQAGMRETVFHLKNKRDYSDWYGRPKALQTLYWQFAEWSTINLISKIANSEIGMKALLAQEAPPINSLALGEDSSAEERVQAYGVKLRKLATQRGNHDQMESLGVLEYPHGATPPTLLRFDLNRDTEYTQLILDRASDAIFAGHGWSKTLTGWERPDAGIGGNVLIDEFMVKNTGTLKPMQKRWASFWKKLLEVAFEQNGIAEYDSLGIRFQDNVGLLVDSLKGSGNTTQVKNAVEEATQTPEAADNVQPGVTPQANENVQENG